MISTFYTYIRRNRNQELNSFDQSSKTKHVTPRFRLRLTQRAARLSERVSEFPGDQARDHRPRSGEASARRLRSVAKDGGLLRRRQRPPPPSQGPSPESPVRVPPHRRHQRRCIRQQQQQQQHRPPPPPAEAAEESDHEEAGLAQGDEEHEFRDVDDGGGGGGTKPGGGGEAVEGSASQHAVDRAVAAVADRDPASG